MSQSEGSPSHGFYGLRKCFEGGNAIVDIVFVHGLTGNREATWTDKATGTFWPEALLKNDIPEGRILTYGYDADVVHFWSMASQNRIANHAHNLVNSLSQLRERSETNNRPLIFVAHSLGGLVVENALVVSKNSAEPHLRHLIECTVGIAFMGTPHCGSDLAHWAKIFGNITDVVKKTNTSLLKVLEPQSEVLAIIQNEFHTMLRARVDDSKGKLKITCFYEELPVKGVGLIVPMHSAILPSYNSIGIRDNHMDMTKFALSEDQGYSSVSNELWRWVKDVRTQSQIEEASKIVNSDAKARDEIPTLAAQPWQHTGCQPYPNTTQYYHQQWPGQQQHQLPPRSPSSDSNFRSVPSENRVFQGGNTISGQNVSGNGKMVQGNNITSEKDVTFNF